MPAFVFHSGVGNGPLGSTNMVPSLGPTKVKSSESDDESTECLGCGVLSDGLQGDFFLHSLVVLASELSDGNPLLSPAPELGVGSV